MYLMNMCTKEGRKYSREKIFSLRLDFIFDEISKFSFDFILIGCARAERSVGVDALSSSLSDLHIEEIFMVF